MAIHYLVADATEPNPEPFILIEIDTDERNEEGQAVGVIRGLYMTQDEADAAAKRLSGKLN